MLWWLGAFCVLVVAFLFAAALIAFIAVTARKIIKHWRPTKRELVVISIDGTLRYSSKPASNFQKILQCIDQVGALEPLPKALVVRISSPGGAMAASQEIYAALRRLNDKGVKIVALMEDVAASGGLYVALAADWIVANSGTMTGSIGVIVRAPQISRLLNSLGIGMTTIKSGIYKDALSPMREVTDEERALLQSVIDDAHEQFCAVVALRRNIPRPKVNLFADGRIMTGAQAKHCGLIDALGGYDDALDFAKWLARIPPSHKVDVFVLRESSSWMQKIGLLNMAEAEIDSLTLSGPLWLAKL